MRSLLPATLVAALLALATAPLEVHAWGAAGHAIVATIAQTQLHPLVREHLCTILPQTTAYVSQYPAAGAPHKHCHLAPLSGWPDTVRFQYPWSGHLHYVNPLNDTPPLACTFGETGWTSPKENVLTAMVNYTNRVREQTGYERDIALRWLTHYVGDAHQPLHLTGRARGGNDVWVKFEGRSAKLHSVWDGLLLNRQIRELSNYTTRLPSTRIESALQGRNYDAYIRWILAEGLGQAQPSQTAAEPWWNDSAEWSSCPPRKARGAAHTWLTPSLLLPRTTRAAKSVKQLFLPSSSVALIEPEAPDDVDNTDEPLCPYAWTKPMHPLVCQYGFAKPVPLPGSDERPELDGDEYAGRIESDRVLQRQFALAGVRLAAILNTVLLPEAQNLARTASPSSFSQLPMSIAATRYQEEEEAPVVIQRHRHQQKGGKAPIWALTKVTASSIVEVALLSSVGYFLARRGIIDKVTQTKLNKINVAFFTPALLFSKVAFTLNPGRLAELMIVPIGFVIVSVTSAAVAYLMARLARLTKAQRNFAIACAMSPNSNSLPVALMQSLVATVPQLHWEEEGEPEDTVDGMLGRALTYLVLFSTLGMVTRWSIGAKLLATVEDDEEETPAPQRSEPSVDQSVDVTSDDPSPPPPIVVRSPTSDAPHFPSTGPPDFARRPSKGRARKWTHSFPNSPDSRTASVVGSVDGDEDGDDELDARHATASHNAASAAGSSRRQRLVRKLIVRPFRAFTAFMSMPLYAALLSLIVAMIRPLQVTLGNIEPVVGALQTAGAVSVPLTMVVLGAYFVPAAKPAAPVATADPVPSRHAAAATDASAASTLVGRDTDKKGKLPRMSNPWGSNSETGSDGGRDSANWSGTDSEVGAMPPSPQAQGPASETTALLPASSASASARERKAKRTRSLERRTIAVSVLSRMIIIPLIIVPFFAYYCIRTRENVADDPVMIVCGVLLISSPPALTLAQITTTSAKGNSSFERLISKTIFISYVFLAAPISIIAVLAGLLITENEIR